MTRPRRSRDRSPPEWLRRRRLRRVGLVVLGLTAAIVLARADGRGWLFHRGDDLARYEGRTARVTRVIDGDTLKVAIPDGEESTTTVRLWGIDTPELAHPWEDTEAEPFASEARALARRLVGGKRVRLDLEPHRPRGTYDRVLAYVTRVKDGEVLSERLLLAGLARAVDRWPHRDRRRYGLLEMQARRADRGMWAGSR